MKAEGVKFETGVEVGKDISAAYLKKTFDAIILTMGAGQPRDLNVPGRDKENVLFAMDFLANQNKAVAGEKTDDSIPSAKGKHVVVIGGGDTGSDCVGTSVRHGAKSVHQFEILPQPSETRPPETPWPMWPTIMRTSSSQQEGCERQWSVSTKQVIGGKGVTELECVKVEWTKDGGQWKLNEVAGSEFKVKADLVLLAMGFVHVVHEGLVNDLGLEKDGRGNIVVNGYQTSESGIFAAGDAASGASLVVRAIDGGRQAAAAMNEWLMA